MRFLMLMMVMVAGFVGAAPTEAALRRTSPVTGAAVTAQWWQRLVKITYPSGRWEYAFQRWYGLADAPTGPYHQGGATGQPISAWSLVGATITVLGAPTPYVP
jgi:hypothetical protein